MQESPWTTEKFSIETPSPIILINPIFISGKTFHTNVFHKEINMEICFFFFPIFIFQADSFGNKLFFPSSYYLKDGRSQLHLPYYNVSSRDDSLCLVLVHISLSTRLPRIIAKLWQNFTLVFYHINSLQQFPVSVQK